MLKRGNMFRFLTRRSESYFVRLRAAKRRREIEEIFPDFLRYTASCLRAGLSLRQALLEAAGRFAGPIGEELTKAAGEIRAGVSVGDALDGLAGRTGSADASAVSAVLQASLKYGGDAASALDRLSAAAVGRNLMRGEVNALTAQARFSAMILSVLPLGFFVLFPAPAGVVLSFKGLTVISIGLALNISGYLILRRMSAPERLL